MKPIMNVRVVFFLISFLFLNLANATSLTRATFNKMSSELGVYDNFMAAMAQTIKIRKNFLKKDPVVIKLLQQQGRDIDSISFDSIPNKIFEDYQTVMYPQYKVKISEEDGRALLKIFETPTVKKIMEFNRSDIITKTRRQFLEGSRAVIDREMQNILRQKSR